MRDEDKTKAQLISELAEMRQQLVAFKKLEKKQQQAENGQRQQEIAERKRAEEAFMTQFVQISTIFDSLNALVYIADMETHELLFMTKYGMNIFGDNCLGKKCYEVLQAGQTKPCAFCTNDRLILNGKPAPPYVWEKQNTAKNIWFQCIDRAITWIDGRTVRMEVAVDITERKQMEKDMARLEQLNLVGEMAAGIGHEVRNPMTTVRGFLQLLRSKKECIQYKEFYDLMIEELDRANAIITEYLTLAKNKSLALNVQNLNSIVTALTPLIAADATISDKYINVDLGEIPDLLLDEKEIRQLILNLARNGLEAMSPGGNLTIKTFTDGDAVVLSVRDQGKGFDPNVLDKIGTPFLTTKAQGTGLGLAICYSIAKRHNAKITVETGPQGTTFFVRFAHHAIAATDAP